MVLIPTLSKIVQQVDHALSAVIFNLDGLTIESVDGGGRKTTGTLDEDAYASIFDQIIGASESLGLGPIEEITVDGEGGTTLARRIGERYMVALQVGPEAVLGKARLALRTAAPDLARHL